MKPVAAALLLLAIFTARVSSSHAPAAGQAAILITLDGARVEEMFGGLDRAVFQSTLRDKQQAEDQAIYRRF
ncbi:MAG: hypothetical protein LC753_20230 [Acidobacteria bacterium]|nr:hypothetical protein [Acidobacteriota bacterium]